MATKYIGIDALIAEASSTIKNFTQQEQQLAMQWAYTALRLIGFGKPDIKVSENLTLTDWSTEKPTDLASTIDMSLFDSAGSEIVIKYKGFANGYNEGTEARIHQDARSSRGAIQVSEDDTYFNVEEFADESPTEAYLVVRYYGYPVDANGAPKIPETHTLAIMMYIRWMWSMRERSSLGEQQVAREVWLREKAAAYGRMKTPSQLEGKEIARTINSMIQKTVVRGRQY